MADGLALEEPVHLFVTQNVACAQFAAALHESKRTYWYVHMQYNTTLSRDQEKCIYIQPSGVYPGALGDHSC